MAPASVSSSAADGVRILSLDGGGVRGLSSLIMLRRILNSIAPHDDLYQLPKPCAFFDLICGTSTGGLIAIMLGRLKMGVQECIDAYCELSKNVFQERLRFPGSRFIGQPRFSETRLEDAIKSIVKDRLGDEEASMHDADDGACKVFVCATRTANTELALLRSYRTPHEETGDSTIWQAARATTAAPTFFNPVIFGNPPAEYADGALLNNNPVRIAVQEARRLWGPRVSIACLASLGTGIPATNPTGSLGHEILKTCVDITFAAERAARSFKEEYLDNDLVRDQRYFRFNVAQGLQGIGLQEWKLFDRIEAVTRTYLEGVRTDVEACANSILERASDQSQSGSDVDSPDTIYFEVPGAPSPYFTGRDDDLSDLSNFFRGSDREALQVAVLAGLGGIGKTQISLKYIESHKSEYVGVFFVDASSEQELRTSFARIAYTVVDEEAQRDPSNDYHNVARTLGFTGLVSDQKPLFEEMFDHRKRLVNAVKKWLARLTEPFLMVFDGADDPADTNLDNYIPRDASGDIIITTRDVGAKYFGQFFHIKELPEDAAVALLGHASNGILDVNRSEQEAKRIVHELGGLPLAIDLAGGYFATSESEAEDFLPTYEKHAKDLLSKEPSDGLSSYRNSAFTTWEMSFAKANQRSQVSGPLLEMLSFVYPQDICGLLYSPSEDNRGVSPKAPQARRNLASEIENGFSDLTKLWISEPSSFAVQEAFTALVKLCLITRLSDRKTYAIHPVVHLWARERLDASEREKYARDAVIFVARALPSMKYLDNVEAWRVHRRLQPHVNACWTNVERYLQDAAKDTRSFLLSLGMLATSYLSQGYLKTAEKMFLRALRGQQKRLEHNHPDTLTTMDNLASIYRDLDNLEGNLDKAEELYNKALAGRLETLGAEHSDTLTSFDHLAGIYEYKGKFVEAEEFYVRVLRGREEIHEREKLHEREKCPGPKCADVLGVVEELASLYSYYGRLDKAEEFHRRALEGREKVLGLEHPDTLASALSFGGLCWAKGDIEEAEKQYERAYAGRKKFFGDRHPQTLSALNGLAGFYGNLGRIDEAEKKYREVLAVRTEVLGPEHPDTLWTHDGLGGLLVNKGELQGAETLLEQTRAGIRNALGENHVDALWVSHSLAILYEHVGRLKDAEELHTRALEGHEAALGPDHPVTLWIMNDLGACYERSGKLEQAEEAIRTAHEGKVRILGFDRPDTLYTGNCLAGALWSLGRDEEAEELYLRVLKSMRDVLGSDHPDTWSCLSDLGGLYAGQLRIEEAELLLTECRDARQAALGAEHPETRQVQEALDELGIPQRKPSHQDRPKRAKTLPSTYSFGRRRRRDERRWVSE